MTPMLVPDTLGAETAVVILEPLDAFPWLREQAWTADGPTCRPPRVSGYRVVAFSTVRPRRHARWHARRLWFVKAGDWAAYGRHDWPVEAVDPMSIGPRRMSRPMGVPPWRQALARREEVTT